MARKNTKAQTAPVVTDSKPSSNQLPPCLCGCGLAVRRPQSQFRQGHDATLKGQLQRHFRGCPRPTDPSLDDLFANYTQATGVLVNRPKDAKDAARKLTVTYNPNWERFLEGPARKAKAPKAAKAKTPKATKPDIGEVVQRKVGRWTYSGRRSGEFFVYKSKTGSGQELRVPFERTHAA